MPIAPKEEGCFICGGISDNLGGIIRKTLSHLAKFEFRTFSIGLTLPQGLQEREDSLRSELRIRGGETVKSALANRIAREVSRSLGKGKKVDRLRPDVTALVDISNGSVAITSKPLFLYGRYTKPRGVSQRRLFCEECNGRGCDSCGGTGHSSLPSVESILSSKLGAVLGSKRFKFTWFGSEDPDSIVFPPGRPLLIESKNPRKRLAPRDLRLRTGRGSMSLSKVKVVTKRFDQPTFTFKTRAVIHAERSIASEEVGRLQKEMKNAMVQYRNNKGRLVYKKVYFVKASKRGKKITAYIKLDGGLPVKRLVSGEAVSPSFSESMGVPLRCDRFDIMGVWPQLKQRALKPR